MSYLKIDGNNLTLEEFIEVTRKNRKVDLTSDAKEKVNKARKFVDKLVEDDKVVYGITTGFGKFSDILIKEEDTKDLQRNLIVSRSEEHTSELQSRFDIVC